MKGLARDDEAGTWQGQTSKPGWPGCTPVTHRAASLWLSDQVTALLSIYLNLFWLDLIQV